MNKRYKYLIAVLLIVSAVIAYGRIAANDFTNFDDDKYITENNYIKEGINAKSITWAFTTTYFSYWHPLTWLSYMLDWRLFGLNASGHHLVSLLLHIGAVLFLFLFLNKATKSLWPSAFVAALFALHPLRVESVAWAAERKDVLSMFFGMASLYAYAYYAEKLQVSKYFICLLLFVLSLLSKPSFVTLPCVLLLLDYWPLARWQKRLSPVNIPAVADQKTGKKKNKQRAAMLPMEKKIIAPVKSRYSIIPNLLREKLPFFFLSIILSVMLIRQQHAVGGMVSLQQTPFPDRIMNAIVSYVAYLIKIFWPVNLAAFYPYEYSFPLWKVFGAASILVVISTAVVCLIKRTPFLAVGWFWYLGTLFPVIGLMQAGGQAMADRYSYFPSIGIGIMLTWGIVYLFPKEKLRKNILFPAAGVVLAILTILTWQQCGYWKNSISLFSHALQVTKNNYLAHDSLGIALDAEGKHQEAMDHYKNAIKINPDYAHAYYNLASAFIDQKNIEEAEKYFRETIRINPNFTNAHNKLGIILEMYYRKYDEAIYHYRQELKIQPDNFGVHYNMGIALVQKGEREEAVKHFQTAIRLNPDFTDGIKALKLTLEETGRRN